MKSLVRYFMTEVRVLDWARSVAWYREVLGLRVVLEDVPGQFALLEAGGGRVALKQAKSAEEVSGRKAIRLVFQVDDLEVITADLIANRVAIEGPSTIDEGYREIRINDPDGTPIGLFSWLKGGEPSI